MSLTIIIAGTYLDPEGNPLPDKTLTFESLYNSSQTQLKTTVKTVTDQAAAYSVALVPNFYSVCELDGKGRSKWLGNIQIFADSPSGTLNEYLTAFKTDQAQPGILAEMEEILEETKQVAADAGFTPRGPWSASVSYEKNDLVQYTGSQYLATAAVTGTEPPGVPWELFVAGGADGKDGPPNELAIGTVETLPAGSPATANITGDYPDQKLNLGLPEGKPAPDGVTAIDDFPVAEGKVTLCPDAESFLNPKEGEEFTPTLQGLIESVYIHLDGHDGSINLNTMSDAITAKTLSPGYTLRLHVIAQSALNMKFHSTRGVYGPDGSNYQWQTIPLSPPYHYVFEVTASIGTASPFINQLTPADEPLLVKRITSGQTLNALTAAVGVYYLDAGARLNNGPNTADLVSIFTALLEVRIKGVCIGLTCTGNFNVSAEYNHVGKWELMTISGVSYWSFIGPGDSANVPADKNWTLTAAP